MIGTLRSGPLSEDRLLRSANQNSPGKKTLQIDFSPLSSGVKKEIIDKSDVNKALVQDSRSLVLNTVMSVRSAGAAQDKLFISDMSLMQPDGTLDQFSLPQPLPAVYDPSDDRLSTVAFDELANVMQQNYVMAQQDNYINVVNVASQVNVVNVADFGGYEGGGYGGYEGGPHAGRRLTMAMPEAHMADSPRASIPCPCAIPGRRPL